MWFGYIKGHTFVDTVNSVSITFKRIYDIANAFVAPVLTGKLTPSLGKFKCSDFYKAVPAKSATGVHAAVTLGTGTTTTVTTAITNPAHYRVLTAKGNQATVEGSTVITGTDWAGNVITDTIVMNGTTEVSGVKPFKTVTSILLPARGAASDSISIGWADVLGLTRPVVAAADVLYIGIAADAINASTFTYEAASAVNTTYHTVTPTSATITANDDIVVEYYASQL